MSTGRMSHVKKIMTHPISILTGALIGGYLGVFHKELGKAFAPWGKLYLSSLQMTIIPYIVVTVSSSVAGLLSAEGAQRYIRKIILTFLGLLVFMSFVGLTAGLVLKPGVLERSEMVGIMKITGFAPNRTITTDEPIEKDQTKGFVLFITDSIPSNIFNAFAQGEVLQIVFFTLVFGIALGVSPESVRQQVFPIFNTLRETFLVIIRAVILLLPVGVLFLFAEQLSSLTHGTFIAMLKFLSMSVILMVILFILCSLIIWKQSKTSYLNSLSGLRDTIFVTFSTRNSLVSMPTAIEEMVTKLKFDHGLVNLVIPLGVSLCRYGNVAYFSFATIFISQIYNTPLSGAEYVIILLGSVLAGFTTSGASGVVTLPMMTLILDPLGLPLGAVLVLFVAIDPLIDPFRSLIIVYGNCAATALVSSNVSSTPLIPEAEEVDPPTPKKRSSGKRKVLPI